MDDFCNSIICVRKFSAIFFLLGSFNNYVCGPNFTQFLLSTQSNGQLRILILDIQSIILCSCDQAWTFYWPPTLLIHIVIEWPHMTRRSNYPCIFLPNWLIKLKKKDVKMLKLGLQNSLFYLFFQSMIVRHCMICPHTLTIRIILVILTREWDIKGIRPPACQ